MIQDWNLDPRDFQHYFGFAPSALAIRECVRLRPVREVDLPEPILDVGCGDGIFAKLAYPERMVWGIDINPVEVRRAQATDSYKTLVCGNIVQADLPPNYFQSAIANCSLEHVPDIQGAFRNIRQSLRPGAPFVLIVPTPEWTEQLLIPRVLAWLGMHGLATQYGQKLDEVFFHVHLCHAEQWHLWLTEAGFDVERTDHIVSPGVAWAFDVLLYPSLLGWVTKRLTGRWTLLPQLRERWSSPVRWLISQIGQLAPGQAQDSPGEYFIVARAR